MAFRINEAAEIFAKQLGINPVYREDISYCELEPHWRHHNEGRTGSAQVEKAVLDYAGQMEKGSPAPAVLLHKQANGLHVLDGVQRLLANDTLGHSKFAGYICECSGDSAKRLRRAANLRLNTSAPVDEDACIAQCVIDFMIDNNDSSVDVADLVGRPKSRIEEIYSREVARLAVASLFDDPATIPKINLQVYKTMGSIVDVQAECRDAPKEMKAIVEQLHKLKLTNGDSEQLLKDIFVKRKGGVTRSTQLRSTRRKHIDQNPQYAAKLQGKRIQPAEQKLQSAVKTLLTRAKEFKSKSICLNDVDSVSYLNEQLSEACRILRQQCTTTVRKNVDPFNLR